MLIMNKNILEPAPDVEVIAPNFKKRISGVTATVVGLVGLQSSIIPIVATGPGLPPNLPHLPFLRILLLPRRTRVWHARRNNELLVGLLLKWLRISKLKIIFTSASPRVRSRWTTWLISLCDEVVATNIANAEAMPRDCKIVPHGVDTVRFNPQVGEKIPQKPKVVGCFGRIRKMKGTDLFVEALCRALPQHKDWSAVVMGRVLPRDRAYYDDMVEKVKNAGLSDRIHFVNERPLDQMADAYRELSIYVAPSHLEGFGLTVAEALSSGVPTIATRGVGAFDELIDESKNGMLFVRGDVDDLVAKICRMMDDDQHLGRMSKEARVSALDRMSLKVEAQNLIEIYRGQLET